MGGVTITLVMRILNSFFTSLSSDGRDNDHTKWQEDHLVFATDLEEGIGQASAFQIPQKPGLISRSDQRRPAGGYMVLIHGMRQSYSGQCVLWFRNSVRGMRVTGQGTY